MEPCKDFEDNDNKMTKNAKETNIMFGNLLSSNLLCPKRRKNVMLLKKNMLKCTQSNIGCRS